jgi:hypothetical protein
MFPDAAHKPVSPGWLSPLKGQVCDITEGHMGKQGKRGVGNKIAHSSQFEDFSL